MRLRPPLLLPARWAHPSWLTPATVPRDERGLRQASARLLAAWPTLANPRARCLRLPLGRPAFARLCRVAAACGASDVVRQRVGLRDRRRLSLQIGRATLDRLQRHPSLPAGLTAPVDLDDRFAMTAHGLALYRDAYLGRPAEPWLALRLPRALAVIDQMTACADGAFARRCVAVAAWLGRRGC